MTIFFLGFMLFAMNSAADSFFFNNTDFEAQFNEVSPGCASALQAPLNCDQYLTYVMTSNYYGFLVNDTLQDQFCAAICSKDLAAYQTNVTSSCANDTQPIPGYPATYWADWAISAFDHMCLKDETTGKYCVDILAGFFQAQTEDSDGTDLPLDQLCSNCVVSLFRLMQSTPYSNYDDNLASVWDNIQTKCSISYPTAVPALKTNLTQHGGFAIPGSGASLFCLSGIIHTVVAGDDCEVIARNYSVATGTLVAINDIYADCTNLLVGQNICIPPQCSSYLVKGGDTCDTISNATSTTFQQLVAWNPSIGSYCTNLLSGQNICVSPPGGVQNLTTIPGATATQTGLYAATTTARPSPVATGTTLDCGNYYQIQEGDTCQLVSLNQTISVDLFESINPSIDTSCSNLELGVYYCVLPTSDWNATVSLTIVSPPTTTQDGTTPDCYQYYVIQSGDTCSSVENAFDISMAQLQNWNPNLQPDCLNLALGKAYCVNAADQSTTTTTTTGSNHGITHMPFKATIAAFHEGGVPAGWPGFQMPNLIRAYAAATQIY